MAFKSRNFPCDGCRVMSLEEFKQWLKKFDSDKDGRISRKELSRAIRTTGRHWFSRRRGKEAIDAADTNHDGFIEEDEVEELVEFALKHLRIKIVPF
ncbi:hypothetical protein CDL15_Pgr014558 [Punica granatum]|uniref:EF-hand domain-containing protein n=1 Tax=Punica granatum TaxID=22663 RepID=A0A218WDI2_PUNGR|nr:hypothetical protein CDL15_Pgr014558 [Punica granatum]PKI69745.1 hypothetical protein CRG98_009901 [Punica granatum]